MKRTNFPLVSILATAVLHAASGPATRTGRVSQWPGTYGRPACVRRGTGAPNPDRARRRSPASLSDVKITASLDRVILWQTVLLIR